MSSQRKTIQSNKLKQSLLSLFPLVMGLFLVFPIVYAILGSFKSMEEFSYPPTFFPRHFYLENFRKVFDTTPIIRFMWNSLVVAVLGTVLELLISIFASYAFAFLQFPGKGFFFILVLGTMMLPADTLFVGNYLTISHLRLTDRYLGIILPMAVNATQVLLLYHTFKSLPRSTYDAARMDGCSGPRFIFQILIPLTRSFLLILGVRTFLSYWNSYLWPLLVTHSDEMRTVQVGITMLNTVDQTHFALVLAAVTVVMLPSLILFALGHGRILDGLTPSGSDES